MNETDNVLATFALYQVKLLLLLKLKKGELNFTIREKHLDKSITCEVHIQLFLE